jgi:hypothetical protein
MGNWYTNLLFYSHENVSFYGSKIGALVKVCKAQAKNSIALALGLNFNASYQLDMAIGSINLEQDDSRVGCHLKKLKILFNLRQAVTQRI